MENRAWENSALRPDNRAWVLPWRGDGVVMVFAGTNWLEVVCRKQVLD